MRRKYEQAGRDAVDEMVLIQGPEINLPPFAEQAVEYVCKAEPFAALFAFCTVHRLPARQKYLREASQHLESEVDETDGCCALHGRWPRCRAYPWRRCQRRDSSQARAMRDFTNDAGMIGHGLIGPVLEQLHL